MKKIKIALAAALFSFQIFCAFAELNYIEIESISNAPIVKVKSLEGFESLISKNNVSTAFLQIGVVDTTKTISGIYTSKPYNVAYINIASTYFSFILGTYVKISDYKEGKSLGFENGTAYYEAKDLNLLNLELYQYYKKNSFTSYEDCVEAKKNNFPTSDEYYAAKEKGYDSYSDYKDYLVWNGKGYKSKEEWLNAKSKGFSKYNAKDFHEAQANGFATADDHQKAYELGFAKNEELQTYNSVTNDLEQILNDKGTDRKQTVIYYFMKKLSKGNYSLRVLSASLKDIFSQSDETTQKTITIFINNENQNNGAAGYETYNNRYTSKSKPSIINYDKLFSDSELNAFLEKTDFKELGSFNKENGIFTKK